MATARIDIETRVNPMPNGRSFRSKIKFDQHRMPVTSMPAKSVVDIAYKNASSIRTVSAGTGLFAEGDASDNLYVVLDGWMLQYRILEDGRRQILDFALAGAVLGYRAESEAALAFSVEALTDAEVAVIPLKNVGKLLSGGTESAIILLEAANDALLDVFDSLTDIGRRTAREAVAHFLFRMDRRIRRNAKQNKGGAVSFPLCQEHIGDALGLTSVHVCRTLGKLRNDRLVELGQGRLRILDVDALAKEAGVYRADTDHVRLAS